MQDTAIISHRVATLSPTHFVLPAEAVAAGGGYPAIDRELMGETSLADNPPTGTAVVPPNEDTKLKAPPRYKLKAARRY
jgi:hypothetical protein